MHSGPSESLLFLEERIGDTNPEITWVLLQTAASELERATEVRGTER